jgi:hypothetical protein
MIAEARTRMANLARPVLLALSLSLSISILPLAAEAGRDRGSSGGGGGRLGQVSSGLGAATGGGGGRSSSSSDNRRTDDDRYRHEHVEYVQPVIVTDAGGMPVAASPTRRPSPQVDFYAGAQKVHESDGSLSLELAFNEGRFRLGGSLSRYYERQQDADALTFTLGTLYLGWRVDDGGPTRAYLEVGGVGGRTRNDPVMNSSVGGVLGGVRVEHRVSRRISVVGDAQVMAFEHDVRAGAMRAGVRYGHLQATLRYFDLNVGPALFGPEVGIRF